MQSCLQSSREAERSLRQRIARAKLQARGVKIEKRRLEPFALSDLSIRTKERGLIQFVPNPVQCAYLETLLPDWKKTGAASGLTHKREILLKARQFGMSTLLLALLFLDTINTPNTQTVVIAHDADSTETLFRMVHRFYDHLPADRRPKKKYSSKREMAFIDNDSYFSVGTAGSGEYGRGGTINNVLGSEVAFWPDAGEIIAGLGQTVPTSGNIFLETTANGVANYYHDEYQASKRGDSAFTHRFYGWNLHPEYQAPVPEDFVRTQEEEGIANRYRLTNEQLQWRRGKVKELKRTKKKFTAEYPINDTEAFTTSAGRVLDRFIPAPAPHGHLVPAFIPPKHWRHFLIIDPGWRKFAALFAAVDPEGRVWLYGEHYEGGRLPREHLAILDAWWKVYGRPELFGIIDSAAFAKERSTTGVETKPYVDELYEAAADLGINWLALTPSDKSDSQALRVNRYFETDLLRVCDNLKNWLWEWERWVWEEPKTGQAQQTKRDPDRPIDRFNHLQDCLRYFVNTLPDPEPLPPVHRTPEERHWDAVRSEYDEAEREDEYGEEY